MEKIFLLPNGFKKVGWIILVPTFVLGVLMTIDGYNGFPSFLLPEWIPLAMKRVLTLDWVGKILNNVAIIGICLGCLFAVSYTHLISSLFYFGIEIIKGFNTRLNPLHPF